MYSLISQRLDSTLTGDQRRHMTATAANAAEPLLPALHGRVGCVALLRHGQQLHVHRDGVEQVRQDLGLDAHISDPFQALQVTTGGFAELGRRLAAQDRPVLLVQEGGYLSDDLTSNIAAVLGAFSA